tara:strand:+ start:364 stop:2739 length:2376 start_codon:yes stop_codon:yes gene_type:complete
MPQTAATPAVPTLQQEFKDRRDTYRGILGDPAEQRKMTQAQMLFDIANTALAFSTAGSRPGMSPAERLAEAAVETQLFPKVGARAQAAQEQKQKFDLAALQSAETSLAAKQKAAADIRKAELKQGSEYEGEIVELPDGQQIPFNVKDPSERVSRNFLIQRYPEAKIFKVGTKPTGKTAKATLAYLMNRETRLPAGQGVYDLNDPKQLKEYQKLAVDPANIIATESSFTQQLTAVPDPTQSKALGLTRPIVVKRPDGSTIRFEQGPIQPDQVTERLIRDQHGDAITTASAAEKLMADPFKLETIALNNDVVLEDGTKLNAGEKTLTADLARKVIEQYPNQVTTTGSFISAGDYFRKHGFTPKETSEMSEIDRRHVLGLPSQQLTDVEFEKLYKMPRATFEALSSDDKLRVYGAPSVLTKEDVLRFGIPSVEEYQRIYNSLDDDQKLRLVTGDLDLHSVAGQLISVSPTGEATVIAGTKDPASFNSNEQFSFIIDPQNLAFYSRGNESLAGLTGDALEQARLRMNRMESFITAYAEDSLEVGGVTTKRNLPVPVQQAVIARLENDDSYVSPVRIDALKILNEEGMMRYGGRGHAEEDIPNQERIITGEYDLAASTGWVSGLKRLSNFVASAYQELAGGTGTFFEDVRGADAQLQALGNATKTFLTSTRDRRVLAQDLNEFEKQIVRPEASRSDAQAREKLKTNRNILAIQKQHIKNILASPSLYKDTSVNTARKALFDVVHLIDEHNRAIALYDAHLSGVSISQATQASDPAQSMSQTIRNLEALGILDTSGR